jgi:penicillin-binding protein 2
MTLSHDRYRLFSRRAFLLGGVQAGSFLVLASRLTQIQLLDAETYGVKAEQNRVSERLLPPIRGRLLDRNGRPMASNEDSYQVVLIPEMADDPEAVLAFLEKTLNIPNGTMSSVRRKLITQSGFLPLVVRDNLNWTELALLEMHATNISGVQVDKVRTRSYPYGASAAHVTGYVGAISEKDIAKDKTGDPVLRIPEARIGKAGLERSHEDTLRGRPGLRKLEVDAHGRVLRTLYENDGQFGEDFESSIDSELQAFAFRRLGEESGSVVVMNCMTGELLALTTAPCYDPAAFYFGMPPALWRELNGNPKAPLLNKPIAGQYAPGSTFKMITALAALRSGINPQMTVHCSGAYPLGSHVFHCWKKEGHGTMNLHSGLAHSCDVYFYDIARRVGIDAIAEAAFILGLGQKTGIEIEGEKSGLIPTERWKRRRHRAGWTTGESLNAGIGQGYILTTPLQLAVMAARLASGTSIMPRLSRVSEKNPAGSVAPLPIDPQHLSLIRSAMYTVVNSAGGTAYGARLKEGSFSMAGKTGTAQVRRITMEERSGGVRKNEELPWHLRDHALFVAYAPAEAPKYAISVIVEHGGSGSKVAAPIARDVLGYLYENQNV